MWEEEVSQMPDAGQRGDDPMSIQAEFDADSQGCQQQG